MKSKLIVLTEPTAWNFTDETTGQFRSGVSAVCFLPFEGVVQSVSNLPGGIQQNYCYDCELGFKQSKAANGRMSSSLAVRSVDLTNFKVIDWSKVIVK